jgi:OPT family oligopeptide transporter
VYLNVLAELIAGYALPGRPVANMLFKTYGYVAAMQAVQFSADLKLGHYMKIPPRIMFTVQTVATVVSCFVVVGVQQWLFANIPDFCSPDQADGWTCPQTSTFASASIIWGAIGPQRVFSYGGL